MDLEAECSKCGNRPGGISPGFIRHRHACNGSFIDQDSTGCHIISTDFDELSIDTSDNTMSGSRLEFLGIRDVQFPINSGFDQGLCQWVFT